MSDRELDALVAEKVMGISVELIHTDAYPREIFFCGATSLVRAVDHYSSTGDGMLAVIEKMRERGLSFEAGWCPEWGADATFWGNGARYLADGPSLPRAVSLAALKALGVEVPA